MITDDAPEDLVQATSPAPAHGQADCTRHRAGRRRLGGVLLVAGGISLVGTGAFASWQSTASASSAPLRTATIGVTVVGAAGGQMSTTVSDLVPGDWLYRYVDITNTSSVPAAFAGTVTAPGLASGLLAEVDTCTAAWTTATSSCTGTLGALTSGALSGGLPVNHGSLVAGAVQHVRYKITVDPNAPSSLMGASGALTMSVVSNVTGNRDHTTG